MAEKNKVGLAFEKQIWTVVCVPNHLSGEIVYKTRNIICAF